MPYFAIKPEGCIEDIGVCLEESIDAVNPELILGPGQWAVREISEDEANKFAEEWLEGEIDPDDICPICQGHRSRQPRGEIVMRMCRNCGFES